MYHELGSRGPFKATPDTTGRNPGNWTSTISDADIGINVAVAELYRLIVDQVPPGAVGRCYLGITLWSVTVPLFGSEWDPQQPLIIRPGQDLNIFWSVPATGTPPTITGWFRYDEMSQPS